ncbi:translocation protein SEC63 homolog [Daktulosphaira vitifoliae]|uniref:translocation protein SEC63 homolog n=1 Tax=Daktulosphaira vitifoliae TaxID=58002 RepID=UPI0021AA3AFE|nr:translocation protein SEC63 homolog [Daktulosphaira vitifoliae]
MAGQKFQYDESGATFFYFILSFLALLLVPGTYYWWPRQQKEDPKLLASECYCPGCRKKKTILQSTKPWELMKKMFVKITIISGWALLAFLAYKVSQFDYESASFDPYDILNVPIGTNEKVIKKAYRKLSLIYHPDKETGDEKKFMKLTKAYQALTDEESRKNWEKYGNPDGPGAMSFGIALPSWIVEKENSFWVLGLYALVFMIALPTTVGMWWYKSIRYSGDKVLLETSRMYYYFLHKSNSIPLKRVIMILSASLEFEKKYNSEIVERSSDEYEMPQLIKQLYNFIEKAQKEPPLSYNYSIKARALVHAHLSRLPLKADTLDLDRMYIVKKCPYLIQEMVGVVSQLILLAYAQRVPRLLNIETIENCMKLCPMVVQALWEYKSPFLQLPYITDDHLKHFDNKKKRVRSIQHLAQLKHEERRSTLKFLSDNQYEDLVKVLGRMPYIDFKVRCEVIDDEATTVYTAGAIVTVTVQLKRQDMKVLFGDETFTDEHVEPEKNSKEKTVSNGDLLEKSDNSEVINDIEKHKKITKGIWQQKRQSGKSSKKNNNKKPKVALSAHAKKKIKKKEKQEKAKLGDHKETKEDENEIVEKDEKETNVSSDEDSDSEISSSSDESDEESDKSDADQVLDDKKKLSSNDDDDDNWHKFQSGATKKDRVLEGRTKQSHLVHCPYFPEDKHEYWWVYLSDRKSRTLLTVPYHVTELVDEEEIQLKFTAPRWPGVYVFAVCLRSDSYFGFDQMHDIKLDVKEAPEPLTEHPQWDISDEEDNIKEEDKQSDISEFTTDEDVED